MTLRDDSLSQGPRAQAVKAGALAHTSVPGEPGRCSPGPQRFWGGPTFNNPEQRLTTEKNDMLAAESTGLLIQVASNLEHSIFPSSFISFLPSRPSLQGSIA